jgi:hypothetical protein
LGKAIDSTARIGPDDKILASSSARYLQMRPPFGTVSRTDYDGGCYG